jgi:hypothetical protein
LYAWPDLITDSIPDTQPAFHDFDFHALRHHDVFTEFDQVQTIGPVANAAQLGCHSRHLATLLCAALASIRATLAMIRLVLATFCATGFADFSAKAA